MMCMVGETGNKGCSRSMGKHNGRDYSVLCLRNSLKNLYLRDVLDYKSQNTQPAVGIVGLVCIWKVLDWRKEVAVCAPDMQVSRKALKGSGGVSGFCLI